MKTRIIAIVGPTAVGKTALTLSLAEKVGGEVISADSMQVYRGMDIGTAKLTPAERARIPHHLIDVVEPGEAFSAADYQRLARAAVDEIASRGRIPIFSGGTGMYIRAAIDDYNFVTVSNNPRVRDELRRQARDTGLSQLYARLTDLDPPVAARVHKNDERRIIRALEVFETTGRPLSFWESQKDARQAIYDAVFIGLDRPRAELYARIDQRVETMVATGLLDEVSALMTRGMSLVAHQALGYKEVIPFLEGRCSFQEMMETLKRETRRYAKRQLTWFRADARVQWLNISDEAKAQAEIMAILARRFGL
ncbi:MAG: tRNA dimethylallyltransferase [Firmicutes bacterium]|nr:tRNA dimethylallyltransferase [candidate division NPL-UPA2 bacterium]MBT9153507.1 tRNA dimethylallyltransferase [candidate division NPL-UPA2 bacterium]MBT9156009.1 tRNA dimethylallyltransferase [candidate division NPL-UPA2 bacterium]